MSITETKIPSTKGNLAAAIHYPENKTDKLAILCPGYLDSKDYRQLVGLAEVLREQGYTVVRFEPTGTWESEGDISDYTTSQYLEDIKSVLEYMLNQTGYKQILLGGHSRGGAVSILYAAMDSRISIVLGIMPSSGWTMNEARREELKKAGVSISIRDLPNDQNKTREFPVPYSHAEDRDCYNVLNDVKRVKARVVLIAGALDDIVLPEDVKEIFNNANGPKKFAVIPNIGHDYRFNDEEIKVVNKKVLELINMKTILIDAADAFVIESDGAYKVFKEMYDLLETFPNQKIILTGATDDGFKKYGLDKMPYEVFTLKHNPEKTDPKYFEIMLKHFGLSKDDVVYFEHNPDAVKSAEAVGIKTYLYDPEKRDLATLNNFLTANTS